MAIFHLSVKTFSRTSAPPMANSDPLGGAKQTKSQRKGVQSAVAAAAYRSGQRLHDERTSVTHDFSRKRGVIHREIFTPPLAPSWAKDRQALWSKAELAEPRKNSTVAREFEGALPFELSEPERLEVAQKFSGELVARHKFGLDLSIHEPGNKPSNGEGGHLNHHAHILTTTRRLTGQGFGEKCRELDDLKVGEVKFWRKRWEEIVNEALERAGHAEQKIDCRSHKARGLSEMPTIKLGRRPDTVARKTHNTEIRRLNREIRNLEHARTISLAEKEVRAKERLARLELLKADLANRKAVFDAMSEDEQALTLGLPIDPTPRSNGLPRKRDSPPIGISPNPRSQFLLAFNLKGNAAMDSINLRNILQSAIAAARIPQDLSLLLQRQGVETQFVRAGDLRDIEALTLKDPDRKEWITTDVLGPDLSWPYIASKKNWQAIVATGLLAGSQSAQPIMIRPPHQVEIELDLLAEQIVMLVEWLRLLIIRIINLVLRHAENAFNTTLPRLGDTPKGVLRIQPQTDHYKPPSRDCISQTSNHIRTLREGIQARDPELITLPMALPEMPKLTQSLRDLKVEESKTPAERHAEAEAVNLAELDTAKKYLAATKRERWDVVSLVNGYTKGRTRPAPADGRKLLLEADAKLAKAERKFEQAQSKFPQLWHDQGDDAENQVIERPRG